MENDRDVRIIKQDEEVKFGDDNKPYTRIRITWKVGADGPFVDYFDKATFNGAAAKAALEARAREHLTLRGIF